MPISPICPLPNVGLLPAFRTLFSDYDFRSSDFRRASQRTAIASFWRHMCTARPKMSKMSKIWVTHRLISDPCCIRQRTSVKNATSCSPGISPIHKDPYSGMPSLLQPYQPADSEPVSRALGREGHLKTRDALRNSPTRPKTRGAGLPWCLQPKPGRFRTPCHITAYARRSCSPVSHETPPGPSLTLPSRHATPA